MVQTLTEENWVLIICHWGFKINYCFPLKLLFIELNIIKYCSYLLMLESSRFIAPNFMPPSFLKRKQVKRNWIERFSHSCQKGSPHSNTVRKTLPVDWIWISTKHFFRNLMVFFWVWWKFELNNCTFSDWCHVFVKCAWSADQVPGKW